MSNPERAYSELIVLGDLQSKETLQEVPIDPTLVWVPEETTRMRLPGVVMTTGGYYEQVSYDDRKEQNNG